MTEREYELTRALREMIALFHARNSGYIVGSRNPYSFKAVQFANTVLTGDQYECGFNVTESCQRIQDNKGSELVTGEFED